MNLAAWLDWLDQAVRRPRHGQGTQLRRLFVDVSTIVRHDAETGIQRVVRSVCRELGKLADSELSIYAVAATKWRPYRIVSTNLLPANGELEPGQTLQMGPGDAFLGLDLCAHLLARHELQLRCWSSAGAAIGVVAYDLLPFAHPEWFSPKTSHHFGRWLDVIGRRADVVLPISRTVQKDLSSFLAVNHPKRASRISSHVLPLSGDIGLFEHGQDTEPDEIVDAMQSRPSILMVGTIEPRKGHVAAVAAHQHAWSTARPTSPYLVIAGKPGWQTSELQAKLRSMDLRTDGLVWLDQVCDRRLDRLYRSCHGVLVASMGEGYCLPLHEALAYSKPVLARDLDVLRELDNAAISYFDRDDPGSLSQALLKFSAAVPGKPIAPDSRGWADSVRAILQAMTNSVANGYH